MICLNCGRHVDDGVPVCPFCGNALEAPDAAPEDDPLPINLPQRERREKKPERPAPAAEESVPAQKPKEKGVSVPVLVFALLSLILGVVSLAMILSLRGAVQELAAVQAKELEALNSSVSVANERLDQLDRTLAKVQTEAYEQVASQNITITKDLTPLVGPVDEGKYNQMFIVKAKGNLNVDTSFDWQRFNEATGGWVSVVFTGEATTSEQYGLRLENGYDPVENVFTTILWANGITPEAAGSYRCVITDSNGVSKTSAEATVSITPAEG